MTTGFDWRLKMKNLGMTGGLALVAAGLLANAFVTLDDDVQAGVDLRNDNSEFHATVGASCVTLDSTRWFAQEGIEICVPSGWFLGTQNRFDLNGDSVADVMVLPFSVWDPILGEFLDPNVLRSRSVKLIDGNWYVIEQPLEFDYSSVLPDPSLSWSVQSHLFDVDGDKKLDLIVVCTPYTQEGVIRVTWHRNIVPANPLAADINLDGIVNGIDLAIVLASWNTPG